MVWYGRGRKFVQILQTFVPEKIGLQVFPSPAWDIEAVEIGGVATRVDEVANTGGAAEAAPAPEAALLVAVRQA